MAKSDRSSFSSGVAELSTILGADAQFEGKLTVKRSMRVDGRVKGELASSETITIGSNGSVEGDITAKDVIVGGKVTGRLTASGKTMLERSSVLKGDLKTKRLVVEEGAIFNGNSNMGDTELASPQHPPRKIQLTEE
ncbi:polymer-forming cytoskeletal protein [bacterium]|nr:polymer-forming cytoskeletal protein [bacterium]